MYKAGAYKLYHSPVTTFYAVHHKITFIQKHFSMHQCFSNATLEQKQNKDFLFRHLLVLYFQCLIYHLFNSFFTEVQQDAICYRRCAR